MRRCRKASKSHRTASLPSRTHRHSCALRRLCMEKGTRLLAEKQKLIKLLTGQPTDGGVVAEYTADELADDSDDEKRLEKAEKAAERKAGLRKRKRLQPALRFPHAIRRSRTRRDSNSSSSCSSSCSSPVPVVCVGKVPLQACSLSEL